MFFLSFSLSFFLSFFLFLRHKYSTFHVEYPELATSFGRFPSQTWILRCGWVLYVYVKYRHKFPSVDSNINQILHNSEGGGAGVGDGSWVSACSREWVKFQIVYFSLYPYIVDCVTPYFFSIAVYVKRCMSLHFSLSVRFTRFLQ
jgi:hypothetical protein